MRFSLFPRATTAATVGLVIAFGLAAAPAPASACGCFTPPDVATPLVQAGEEILFVAENGKVTMHVRIKYSGRSGDFGWILPLPSVPTNSQGAQGIDIGSDELFQQLETHTQPTYILQRNSCNSGGGGIGCGAAASLAGAANFDAGGGGMVQTPLVKQDTIGPYTYAVLKADDKSAMLGWLGTNGYVVPTGTDQAVNQYIRPGGYFLALKLRAGATAGDLQPVVISYPADLPMVPIVLTSVGAAPHMGILVWVLGNARAIPRNYEHTVVDDAKLDWLNQVANYNDVVIQAVGEAEGKHAFVTEYAGTSSVMNHVLDEPGRFDALATAATVTDPATYISKILPLTVVDGNLSFYGNQTSHVKSGFALNGQFYSVVGAYVPEPAQLISEGVSLNDYYTNIVHYLHDDRLARPAAYADIATKLAAFDPAGLTKDLTDRIVTPTLSIGATLSSGRLGKLTRLYTTLSPEDMTVDPVFSFNATLPDVANVHNATFDPNCTNPAGRGGGGGHVTTENGFVIEYTADQLNQSTAPTVNAPASQRIERLYDTGTPQVVTDNTQAIRDALHTASGGGCATASPRRPASAAPFLSLCAAGLAALLLRRRRDSGRTRL